MISAADPSTNGVNSKDEEGWAPIHSAASIGNAEIIEILLSRGEFRLMLLSRLRFRLVCLCYRKLYAVLFVLSCLVRITKKQFIKFIGLPSDVSKETELRCMIMWLQNYFSFVV